VTAGIILLYKNFLKTVGLRPSSGRLDFADTAFDLNVSG
jgi:hypothetical protein